MRSIVKRTLGSVAVVAATTASVFMGVGTAQAAVTCVYNPNPVCTNTPTVNTYTYATSTAVDVTPEPAIYSGVNQATGGASAPIVAVKGWVKTLSSAGNGASKAGTLRLYFTRTAVTSTPVFVGTIPVSSTGWFSKSFKASYSGSWRVVYGGNTVNVSSTKVTKMMGSTSAADAVEVRKVTRAAGVLRFADESAGQVSSFTTDNYGFRPGRPVSVRADITSCTAPMGSFEIGVIRDGVVSAPVAHAADATTANRTDVFTAAAATGAYITGLDASCNVKLTLTQQRPANVVTVN